jgi:hypothetical protein
MPTNNIYRSEIGEFWPKAYLYGKINSQYMDYYYGLWITSVRIRSVTIKSERFITTAVRGGIKY